MCGMLGVEVPGQRKEQQTQTVIVWLLKTHFFLRKIWPKGPRDQALLAPLSDPLNNTYYMHLLIACSLYYDFFSLGNGMKGIGVSTSSPVAEAGI